MTLTFSFFLFFSVFSFPFFFFSPFSFFFLLFLSSWTASNLGRHKTSLSLGRLLSSPNSYLPSYLLFLHLRAINNTQSWLRVKMAWDKRRNCTPTRWRSDASSLAWFWRASTFQWSLWAVQAPRRWWDAWKRSLALWRGFTSSDRGSDAIPEWPWSEARGLGGSGFLVLKWYGSRFWAWVVRSNRWLLGISLQGGSLCLRGFFFFFWGFPVFLRCAWWFLCGLPLLRLYVG